jgi:hypothetical protein
MLDQKETQDFVTDFIVTVPDEWEAPKHHFCERVYWMQENTIVYGHIQGIAYDEQEGGWDYEVALDPYFRQEEYSDRFGYTHQMTDADIEYACEVVKLQRTLCNS